jgi:Holliday junction resolvase RusA-like endonuclease
VIGKGRPHFVKKTGAAITPPATKSYESVLRDKATPCMQNTKPWTGPVSLDLWATYKIPKSWKKADREAAMAGLREPGKPDLDNVVKILADSLNRVVYLDDTQITKITAQKLWSTEEDRLDVVLCRLV